MSGYGIIIVMPVYNEEAYVARAIDSILSQTYEKWSLVISDNNSIDGTRDIIRKYEERDSRIKAIYLKENVGPIENFNLVKASGGGDYFMFMGGHDCLCKDYLKQMIDFIEEYAGDFSLVYPRTILIDSDDNEYGEAISDIDSTGLSVTGRIDKIIRNLNWGSAVYGLYDMDVIRCIELNKRNNGDLYMLTKTALSGQILYFEKARYLRREFRNENKDDMAERYKNWKLGTTLDDTYDRIYSVSYGAILSSTNAEIDIKYLYESICRRWTTVSSTKPLIRFFKLLYFIEFRLLPKHIVFLIRLYIHRLINGLKLMKIKVCKK